MRTPVDVSAPPKVGIVVVSYNAAAAVRVTLASLRRARNETPHELVLVDNASRHEERARIEQAFEHHRREAALPWKHVQLDKNLGFAGGNNVGIRALLADPSISHVCLLNSDVIVSNRWLDRLLDTGVDIVSPTTNKAESEQCVPVDYDLDLAGCLEPGREALPEAVFATVDDFASRRHLAWGGHVVDCDATFFCVVVRRAALERIGFLDEHFFPGGYEDDDYCARARQLGIRVHLDRGVFVHHWGSASFGQLDPGYFGESAARNRRYLEQKHGFTWRIRPEKPFVSFSQDMAFALQGRGDRRVQLSFFTLYCSVLGKLLAHHRGEFAGLQRAVKALGEEPSPDVGRVLETARLQGDLDARWRRLHGEVRERLEHPDSRPGAPAALLQGLQDFAEAVHAVVSSNLAMHAFVAARGPKSPQAPFVTQSLWHRALTLLRHGVPFLLRLRGIVFFGGYPYPARENDGYFQRIRAIDDLFEDRWRIYFDPEPLPGTTRWFDLPAPRTLVLRPFGGRLRTLLVSLLVRLCALRCRAVYFHSVLRMQDLGFGRLMRWPWLRKVLDVHGAVPEEFRMHDDFYSAVLFDKHEESAVRRATALIVVSESMRAYFAQKYRQRLPGEVIVLPIFPSIQPYLAAKPYVDGRPVVVYAGGLHKWQQVPKMIDAIARTYERCLHRFYCTDPDAVLAMLPQAVLASGNVVVDRKSHAELIACYRQCHFGLVLRADSVVNRVACPTKIVEYLAMGIVPIVDYEQIGDFASLGLRYVTLADFLAGKLPDAATRDAMAAQNLAVHASVSRQREAGAARLRQVFGPGVEGARSVVAEPRREDLPPVATSDGSTRATIQAGRPASATAAKSSLCSPPPGADQSLANR